MIQVWKILHGFSIYYLPGEIERQTKMTSDPLNLKIPIVHTEIRRKFLSARVKNMLNDIPYEIKNAGNLNIFKNKCDNWRNY